jgi:hypothetical protein
MSHVISQDRGGTPDEVFLTPRRYLTREILKPLTCGAADNGTDIWRTYLHPRELIFPWHPLPDAQKLVIELHLEASPRLEAARREHV